MWERALFVTFCAALSITLTGNAFTEEVRNFTTRKPFSTKFKEGDFVCSISFLPEQIGKQLTFTLSVKNNTDMQYELRDPLDFSQIKIVSKNDSTVQLPPDIRMVVQCKGGAPLSPRPYLVEKVLLKQGDELKDITSFDRMDAERKYISLPPKSEVTWKIAVSELEKIGDGNIRTKVAPSNGDYVVEYFLSLHFKDAVSPEDKSKPVSIRFDFLSFEIALKDK